MRPATRQLPEDPRAWTVEERADILAVYETFTATAHGRRTLEILRRDLWDRMSAVATTTGGQVILDRDTSMLNEGRRHAFDYIDSFLDAYLTMTGQPKERP